ncbi:Parvalbumin [Parasponia andersonii]|uniref:Parvalbumin n=1 Tax=Parasponia andersonii TaxID=3476 RepID=A0A2P5D4I1_PARAD|nr:Parvalbumin [Parasponia andersonii]
MGKGSLVIYIAIAIVVLLLVSRAPRKSTTHHHNNRHRRLKLRSNYTFPPPNLHHPHHHESVPFDPVVADLERRREDKQWEKQHIEHSHPELAHHDQAPGEESQPEWEEYMDAEDYLNDEERFNVTNRLVVLFPKVDVDPADGFVTEDELTEWNLKQAQTEVMHRTRREMELHDKNHDGLVSFTEYDPPSWARNTVGAKVSAGRVGACYCTNVIHRRLHRMIKKHDQGDCVSVIMANRMDALLKLENNSFGYDMGWWKEEHFNASDADGDGLLNITEFNDFLHPADSKNPKLLKWLCKEEVRERDTDKDGKVNFKEFFHGLFDLVRNYEEESHNVSHHSDDSMEAPAKVLFAQLDRDGDGFLSDLELLPVIGKLHPSERYYAKQQADYIISQADTDKDGRLTLAEMIENPYVFYSAIFSEDEDDYEYHDEFR